MNYCGFNIELYYSDMCVYPQCPQTLVKYVEILVIGFGDYTDLLWWMWFKQLVLPIDH